MGPTATSPERSPGSTAAVIVAVIVVLALGALEWHHSASVSYRASLRVGIPLDTRATAANRAAQLEPWNRRFRMRATYVVAWLRSDELLRRGDYKDAVDVLSAAIGHTLAEPDLLALYHRAQDTQTLETNRKAHLQHGHEGPGGTLTPANIER